MDSKHINEASKFLSYVLRHKPHSIGLELDSDGWAEIDQLIIGSANEGRNINREMILAILTSSEKKRFAISSDGQHIRALQGHSSENVSIRLPAETPPTILYHGTATRFLKSIQQQGLISGSRHHVHLTKDKSTALAVGQRYGKPVILIIDSLKMHQDGLAFYLAENGIWLTTHVPPQYIMQEQGSSI